MSILPGEAASIAATSVLLMNQHQQAGPSNEGSNVDMSIPHGELGHGLLRLHDDLPRRVDRTIAVLKPQMSVVRIGARAAQFQVGCVQHSVRDGTGAAPQSGLHGLDRAPDLLGDDPVGPLPVVVRASPAAAAKGQREERAVNPPHVRLGQRHEPPVDHVHADLLEEAVAVLRGEPRGERQVAHRRLRVERGGEGVESDPGPLAPDLAGLGDGLKGPPEDVHLPQLAVVVAELYQRGPETARASVYVQRALRELDRAVPPPVPALEVHRAQPHLPVAPVRPPRPREERPGRADVARELLEAGQLEEDAAPSLLGDAVVGTEEELPRLGDVVARHLGPAGREPYLPG
mmetsp:Transcript_31880/g.76141  ORF Transcript_31880/g.76141 Transcript_31880/m.76141 type:complete len:346 (-) Transcript_31880:10-1047(-)